MNKTITVLVIGLIVGGISGYFSHAYQFRTQLEEARNFEAKQALDNFVYGDVTSDVQITCNSGNKKTISGTDSGLKFSKNDFDADGNFVGYDKNAALQNVCGISNAEASTMLEKTVNGENTPKLFDVKLSVETSLQGCLNKLKDPLGIGSGTDTEAKQRQECFTKFPPKDKNNPLGI